MCILGYCDGIAYGSWFKRQSSSESYLRKLVKQFDKQSKLTILADSIVEKILFDANKKAIGVKYYDKVTPFFKVCWSSLKKN